MKEESLEELGAAFKKWRATKRHLREAMPEELVERARRTARVHGVQQVARAVKVDGRRLEGTMGVWRGKRSAMAAPGYSRVEMVASAGAGAFAELEMPNGVKVRLYSQTEQTLGLLSALCGGGGR